MTTSLRKKLCLALVLPVVAPVVLAAGASGTAQASPDHYSPPKGATFNNPYGGSVAAHRIVHKLVRTINSVKKGHKIRIASWNFRSNAIANALIARPPARRERAGAHGLRQLEPRHPQQHRAPDPGGAVQGQQAPQAPMKSWLQRCHGSCRGHHGIAHVKFYAFDKVQQDQGTS